jgi:hypothetical protein
MDSAEMDSAEMDTAQHDIVGLPLPTPRICPPRPAAGNPHDQPT